ncbi:hypothetical protein J2853_005106 [Streptosporangium lutulentum]|uniref:Uncharacterized protein n=1 Tax=Streptosporangium lutulentum TaxID=1461250 RepID=A0ABT9QGK5_9ACTN|nr:hypothetical protein [Streptosporangium lutulentum]
MEASSGRPPVSGFLWVPADSRAARAATSSGAPTQRSSPSGPAISVATISPTVLPDTRRITSPTRNPYVRA